MDVIRNEKDPVGMAELHNTSKLACREDLACGVMRVGEQHNLCLGAGKRHLKGIPIETVAVHGARLSNGHKLAPVALNQAVEGVIHGSERHHGVIRLAHQTNDRRGREDNARAVHDPVHVHVGRPVPGKPAGNTTLVVTMVPAGMAKDGVFHAGAEGIHDLVGHGEVGVRDGKGKHVCAAKPVGRIVPLGAVGTHSVDDTIEVVTHISPFLSLKPAEPPNRPATPQD